MRGTPQLQRTNGQSADVGAEHASKEGALFAFIERHGHARGLVLDNLDLSGADFSGIDLSGCTFKGRHTKLVGADFSAATLDDVAFEGADLRGADLSDVHGRATRFRECALSGASAVGATFVRPHLTRNDYGHVVEAGTERAAFGECSHDDVFLGARLSKPKIDDDSLGVEEVDQIALIRTLENQKLVHNKYLWAGIMTAGIVGLNATGMPEAAAAIPEIGFTPSQWVGQIGGALTSLPNNLLGGSALGSVGAWLLRGHVKSVWNEFKEYVAGQSARVDAALTFADRIEAFMSRQANNVRVRLSFVSGDAALASEVSAAIKEVARDREGAPDQASEVAKVGAGYLFVCDEDNWQAALQQITSRLENGNFSQERISYIEPAHMGTAKPTSVTWSEKGRIASWQDESGNTVKTAVYDASGALVHARDREGAETPDVPEDFFVVARNFAVGLSEQLGRDRLEEADVAQRPEFATNVDFATHYLDVKRKGEHVFVRDRETGEIDNPNGPSVLRLDHGSGLYEGFGFDDDGKLVPREAARGPEVHSTFGSHWKGVSGAAPA